MKTTYKTFFAVAIIGLLFLLFPADNAFAGQCQIRINFQAQPNPVPENGTLNLTGYVDMSGSVWEGPGSPNAGFCFVGTTIVRAIAVQFTSSGGYSGLLAPNQVINLQPNRTTAYDFSATFKPADQGLRTGRSFIATAVVFTSDFRQRLTASLPVTVGVGGSVSSTYACVADDGKYACSPANNPTCSDVPNNACQGKTCGALSDSNKCGQVATAPVSPIPSPSAGPGGTTRNFDIPNPIGINTFQELVNVIGRWIFNLAIPIAVIIIIYAGVLMLTSGGDPGRFKKGMSALKYAVIGLAIVLIGKGFVSLIKSILSLRNPS